MNNDQCITCAHGCDEGTIPYCCDPAEDVSGRGHCLSVSGRVWTTVRPEWHLPQVDLPSPKPSEHARRKGLPVATGVLAYFPDAIYAVSEVSRIGNEQHSPGQPMHWAKEKSTDEPDALCRHLIDWLKGERFDWIVEDDGTRVNAGRIAAKIAWRALALLQRELDREQPLEPISPRGKMCRVAECPFPHVYPSGKCTNHEYPAKAA